MEKIYKFGIIGAGFMSTAIVKGIINSSYLTPEQIIVSDINQDSLDKMSALGVKTTTDNLYLSNNCEFLLFAVKPQNVNDVLQTIKNTSCKKFISIMAGIKKQKIKTAIDNSLVARLMPNTPCSIGFGAIGIDLSDYKEEKDKNFIVGLFSSLAEIVEVEESDLNVVTGISGSAPAYFYLFVKDLIEAAVKNGLDRDKAKRLITATMIGSGQMIRSNKDLDLDDLIKAVCSKGGTTIEAVKSFDNDNLNDIVNRAVNACIKRSEELEELL